MTKLDEVMSSFLAMTPAAQDIYCRFGKKLAGAAPRVRPSTVLQFPGVTNRLGDTGDKLVKCQPIHIVAKPMHRK